MELVSTRTSGAGRLRAIKSASRRRSDRVPAGGIANGNLAAPAAYISARQAGGPLGPRPPDDISDGKLHDVHALDLLLPEPGAIYVMDRGYVDFGRLNMLHQAGAFVVTRAKSNMDARRVYSAVSDRAAGIICDQTIAIAGVQTIRHYPEHLRRVRFKDPDTGTTLSFPTNQRTLPTTTICALYTSRWQVEQFFKWIKQHLRIKRFYGTSENAVKTQIWIAVSVYLLVAIVKKRLDLDEPLYTLLRILSLTLFEKMPILPAWSQDLPTFELNPDDNQLHLFDC